MISATRHRRFQTAMLCLAVVSLSVGAWFLASPKLPTYEGKDVYYWMMQTRSSSLDDNPGLKAIGTNAIPHLARAVRALPTRFDRYALLRQPPVQKALAALGTGFTWTRSARDVRRAAVSSLLTFGFESRPALDELHAALTDPSLDEQTRQKVIWVLLENGPPPESLPHLLQAWPLTANAVSSGVRHDLVAVIGRIAKHDPKRCLRVFLAELKGSDPMVRDAAASGVSGLGPVAHEAAPALELMLLETNAHSPVAAVFALGRVTNSLPTALPRLRELAHGTNSQAAAGAALTLWRWGEPAEESVAILTNLLMQKDGKGVAAEYLGLIGPAAKSALPALLRASQEDIGAWVDRYDRARCALSVLRIGGSNEVAVRELEAALSFAANPWVRYAVARDLADQGPLAGPLLPALRRNLADPDRDARHFASIAIQKIEAALQEKR